MHLVIASLVPGNYIATVSAVSSWDGTTFAATPRRSSHADTSRVQRVGIVATRWSRWAFRVFSRTDGLEPVDCRAAPVRLAEEEHSMTNGIRTSLMKEVAGWRYRSTCGSTVRCGRTSPMSSSRGRVARKASAPHLGEGPAREERQARSWLNIVPECLRVPAEPSAAKPPHRSAAAPGRSSSGFLTLARPY